MTEALTISLQEQFKSPNGGISMCVQEFGDFLVEHGLDHFYQVADEKTNTSSEMTLHNHYHFLRIGVEFLGNERLKDVIVSLKKPFAKLIELREKCKRCNTSLEEAETQWLVVAEQAKQEVVKWRQWAFNAESSWRKNSGLFNSAYDRDSGFCLRIFFSFSGAEELLESHERLQKSLEYFEKIIKNIQATISKAYLKNELPEELRVGSLDMAINELMEHQKKFTKLMNQKAEAVRDFDGALDAYRTQKKPLTVLLSELPTDAQWALFNIYRLKRVRISV